jgi:sRNA-binding protein
MSSNPAFAEAIRTVVAKEVLSALAPYREALASLVEFTGGSLAATSGKSRVSSSEPAAAPIQRRRGRKARSSAELVAQFTEGQKVQYRQGRGTFDAKVIEIDPEKGMLRLEREKDSKEVVRPAAKVIAA